MRQSLEVRPFLGRADYELMIDYFLNAEDAFLVGMGVDRNKLPAKEHWLESLLSDHERPNPEKERAYLAWVEDGTPIGHSSINKIQVGEEAFIHLHLWSMSSRRSGLGTRFFGMSVDAFSRTFSLKRLHCEPFAENAGPNRVLAKSGFQFVKRYRTVPGPINFEQDVNHWLKEVAVEPGSSICFG